MQKTLTTAEQLLAMGPDAPYELVQGELVPMPPSGDYSSAISVALAHFMAGYVFPKKLGTITGEAGGYQIRRDPDTVLAPDIAFVARERLSQGQAAGGFGELAVEVVSPSQSQGQAQNKARLWLDAGVRLVLVLYPDVRLVVAYRPSQPPAFYGPGECIDFSPVFSDFSLPVDDAFSAADVG